MTKRVTRWVVSNFQPNPDKDDLGQGGRHHYEGSEVDVVKLVSPEEQNKRKNQRGVS